MKFQSYTCGQWVDAKSGGVEVFNAISGDSLGFVSSEGIDFADMLHHARTVGGPALRKMTLHDRAQALKALARYLLDKKGGFYQVSAWTGATKADSWVDIEGGIGTLFSYSGVVRREFSNDYFHVEGGTEPLSKGGSFVGRHILVPKEGVAVHINAFNFPCWGMLEKIAPSLAAGMPVVVKPATVSCYLTEVMVKAIIASGIFPEGSIQLICGSTGDLFEHLGVQDVVTFTGSASTGRMLKAHPNILAKSVPFNMEADSLNYCILGQSVKPEDPEFDLFIKEIVREMTVKAGQKCTAIRRTIVPADRIEAVSEALKNRLDRVVVGDPAREGVQMGSLVGQEQQKDLWEKLRTLAESCEVIYGGTQDFEISGGDREKGAFFPNTLLYCEQPLTQSVAHEIEAFGPVSTLMPYQDTAAAIEIAKLGKGSLVGSIFTHNDDEARELVLGTAAWHGRLLVNNRDCAKESTGHGSPLPSLVHGGPGRAGGGEELGGARAVKHYMQRTALQGSPTTLMAVSNEYTTGAAEITDVVHPFRKHFEDLRIGETLTTHRRTVTEADIVNFGCVSGDHFYAHFDDIAARESPIFKGRVAHGYFVISAAAGMFVDPAPGPVLANYGLEDLRFVEPVSIGDTIHCKLTVKQKVKKDKKEEDEQPQGIVRFAVRVFNQNEEVVAVYDILTLVARREE